MGYTAINLALMTVGVKMPMPFHLCHSVQVGIPDAIPNLVRGFIYC